MEQRGVMDKNGKHPFGSAFCIHPEFLNYLIKNTKEKTVLEVGGADGINSILLSLAGAKKIYMNDINKIEIERFKKNVKILPEDFRNGKFIAMGDDIFKYLKLFQKKNIKVDIVVMRNVLHFFNKNQEKEFFENIKKVMNKDALFYASVNGIPFYNELSTKEKNIKTNYFETNFITLNYKNGDHHSFIQRKCIPVKTVKEDAIINSYVSKTVYTFSKQNSYEDTKSILESISKEYLDITKKNVSKNILKYMEKIINTNKEKLHNNKFFIRVLSNKNMKHFSEESIKSMFEENGFNAVKLSKIDNEGHAFKKEEEVHNFTGIIAKLK